MNKKQLLITGLLVIAISLGYFLGTKKAVTPENLGPQSSHQEEVPTREAKIPGVEHIHALTYDAQANLLLGTHGGLFKSADRGKTWQKVNVRGSVNADDWMSLVPDPRNHQIIFAGGHDLGVIKSTDGGTTWMRSDEGIRGTDIHGLTINQRNPDMLFAYSVGNGVFRSKDGGASWHRMDDGPENQGVRAFAYMAVQTTMDKSMGWDNWGLLFAGTADGISQAFSCFCGWVTTTNVFTNTTVYTLATLHKDIETMYAGTKDGLWKTADEGKTWKQSEGPKGMKITAIAINPDDPHEVIASTEDGTIYRSGDAGTSWQQMN